MTGGSIPLLCLEGFHDLRGTPQDEAGLRIKVGRTKELGGKPGVLIGLDLPSAGVGTEAGV